MEGSGSQLGWHTWTCGWPRSWPPCPAPNSGRWAPLYLRGLLLPASARTWSRWRPVSRLATSSNCITLCPPRPGRTRGWSACGRTGRTAHGGPEAVLVVDDTALVKQGRHSVGVQRQYCGQLGKRANCQALVSLTLARVEVPVPVALRLFLPDGWSADPSGGGRPQYPTTCPVAEVADRSGRDRPAARPGRTLRVRAGATPSMASGRLSPRAGRPGPALGAGPGADPEGVSRRRDHRHARARASTPFPRRQAARPRLCLPIPPTRRSRPCRGAPAPRDRSGPPSARNACAWPTARSPRAPSICRGPSAGWCARHRATGERKLHLTNHPAETTLEQLAAATKARWSCEQSR